MNERKDGQPVAELRLNSQACLHQLGTSADKDPLVFGNRHDPALGIKPQEMPLVMLWQQSDYMLGFQVSVVNQAQRFVAPPSPLGKAKVDLRQTAHRQVCVSRFRV